MSIARHASRTRPMQSTIQRPVALTAQVHAEILHLVHSGQLPPSAHLSPAVLARRLGVSRTPVREALVRLVSDGVVDAVPGRAFVVRGFSVREVLERYPVLWTLESLALAHAGPFPAERLSRLRRVDAELAAPGGTLDGWMALDEQWHATLLEGCPNQALLAMAAAARQCLRRYGFAYALSEGRLPGGVEGHAAVRELLEDGRADDAARALERHWTAAMRDVAGWLGARGA